MRWLRIPLLHFLVGGAILFRLVHTGLPATPGERVARIAPVTITAADVGIMRAAYTRETGLPVTPADEVALIDRAIDEELLFREALARGLDRNDRSVRNWLIEQMRAVTEDREANADDLYAQARALELDQSDLVVRRILVQKMRLLASRAGERGASDEELRDFYAQHEGDYRQPDRITFWHVFLRSGSDVARRTSQLLADLRGTAEQPADAVRRGDPFPLPSRLVLQARPQLEKLFGVTFADEIARLEPGSWGGPVLSAYGAHLVWVEAREPGVVPSFESVRSRVLERWREEGRARRLTELMAELRTRHSLDVESAAWRERRHA